MRNDYSPQLLGNFAGFNGLQQRLRHHAGIHVPHVVSARGQYTTLEEFMWQCVCGSAAAEIEVTRNLTVVPEHQGFAHSSGRAHRKTRTSFFRLRSILLFGGCM